MSKNDQSCCRAEPRCKNEQTCDYYFKGPGPVHLGGIYEPPPPVPKVESRPPSPEEEDDGIDWDLERRKKCNLNAEAWAQNFKDPCPPKESIPCGNSEIEMVLQQLEGKTSSTGKLMKQPFGGVMGYTVATEPASIYDNAYLGLKGAVKEPPDYPADLHMRKICKHREGTSRLRRPWDDFSSLFKDTVVPKFSPSPETTPGEDGKSSVTRLTNTRADASCGQPYHPTLGTMGGKKRGTMPVSADEHILNYIEKHNLISLMEYFLALSCLTAPANPFKYISDLARQMILARADDKVFAELIETGLFKKDHVAALYRLFDKEQNGFVSLTQYKTGMETLGLLEYNQTPEGYEIDKITEEIFVSETMLALEQLLRSFMVTAAGEKKKSYY